jgi:outer membrane protein, adhesin transport system
LTVHPTIQKPLAALGLLCATVSHGQVADPIAQSPLNYRHYLGHVVQQHPSVQAALNQIESAQQDVVGAKWQFGPTPSIGAERSNNPPANALTDRRTSFARLQQPLWTGGRLTAQLDRAQAQETIARLTMEEQRLTLSTRWLQLWTDVQAADLKVQAFADSEDQHRKYVQQVQSRVEEGYAPRSDVQLSLTRLAAVQAELEQARTQKRQAVSKLEQMHGAPLPVNAMQWTAPLQVAPAQSTALQRTASEWLIEVQDKHPSLQKAAVTALVVKADVELAKSKSAPELYVRGEILNGDVTHTTRQIYVGVSSNFGAGLSVLSTIAAAQAKLDAQEHETEARRRDIAEQVLTDVESLESQTQRLRYLEQASSSADEFLQSSERQFVAGRKSWQELMNTAREKAQTLSQLADAKSFQWLSQQRLHLLSMGVEDYLNNSTKP